MEHTEIDNRTTLECCPVHLLLSSDCTDLYCLLSEASPRSCSFCYLDLSQRPTYNALGLPFNMAQSTAPTYKYFNVTYPHPFVAHVEINRPDKLNAFIEP